MSRIARVDSLGRFLATMRCYGCMSSRSNVGFLGLCGVERMKWKWRLNWSMLLSIISEPKKNHFYPQS